MSVCDTEITPDLDEDTIMRIIREEYLHDSTVTLVLVGWETAERPYVNSEIQASLRDTSKNKHNGLFAVIRDDLYDYIYSSGNWFMWLQYSKGLKLRSLFEVYSEFGKKESRLSRD